MAGGIVVAHSRGPEVISPRTVVIRRWVVVVQYPGPAVGTSGSCCKACGGKKVDIYGVLSCSKKL